MWNQSVRAGLQAVKPWISSVPLYRRWTELASVFADVQPTPVTPEQLERLTFNRQAARYRSAIEWVRWILLLLSPELRVGQSRAPGLLFDMNLLFQQTVAVTARRAGAALRVDVSTQESDRYLAHFVSGTGRGAFRLRPDFVLRRGGAILSVGDAKWKRLAQGPTGRLEPDEDDMYQIHAYASAYGCKELALIYPWHSGIAGSVETSYELMAATGLRPRVSIVCVDISSRPMRVMRGKNAPGWDDLLTSEGAA